MDFIVARLGWLAKQVQATKSNATRFTESMYSIELLPFVESHWLRKKISC